MSVKKGFKSQNEEMVNVKEGFRSGLEVQYKSLKLDRNGGKSEKSKTIFVTSPIKDLDSFYQKLFPK